MANKFVIYKNEYLNTNTTGYFNCYYTGFNNPENPDFINTLKNTFNTEPMSSLLDAKHEVTDRIVSDLSEIITEEQMEPCTIVCIPRAKTITTYTNNQLFFIAAVSEAAKKLPGVTDGTSAIQRHTDTRTTHLKPETGRVTSFGREDKNEGSLPYPGITKDTCDINYDIIKNKNIILIDDIYTKRVNIDEDCLQMLYDAGANKVVFYSIAYTKGYK